MKFVTGNTKVLPRNIGNKRVYIVMMYAVRLKPWPRASEAGLPVPSLIAISLQLNQMKVFI